MKYSLKKILTCFCFASVSFALHAEEYPVSAISDDLKKEANAVVRYEETFFSQTDLNNATEKVVTVITILNENGKNLADVVISQDKFSELKSFSGEIFLASGKSFKKIKKSDLTTSAYSNDLASDDYYSYYTPSPPSYPYTVKYTYEVRKKNGIAYYPSFIPVPGFDCAVEKSVLSIRVPSSMPVRFKKNDLAALPVRSAIDKDSLYTFSCENVKAVNWEPMCPSLQLLTPVASIAPTSFCFDKVCGDMSSWQGVGLFLTQLQDKRTTLSAETTAKLQQITAPIEDTKGKVKALYDYLQDKTRYVSIQLGIGGWQPIAAEQVDKTGFGDCKALVNYMKALLSAVDIRSEYAIVHTGRKRMMSDFSSPTQANHVILLVPIENDSIWLECTSRDLPYGFTHSNMAGHDVLLVSGEQSKLCTVPDMPDTLNTETNIITLKLNPDATATASIKNIYKNHETESMLRTVLYKPENEKINDLAERLSVNKAQIRNIKTHYDKSEYPEVVISYDMQAEKYANLTGQRMFVALNPLRSQWGRSFSAASRKLPIHVRSAIHRTDTISIELPEGYKIESGPKSVSLQSKFGEFSSSIENTDTHITVVQQLYIPSGTYTAEEYSEMKDFFKKTDTNIMGQIVLRKN